MSDTIYFILVATFVVISLIFKAKKAQQKTQDQTDGNPTPAVPNPWEEMMREIQKEFKKPEEPKPQPQPVVEYVAPKYERVEKIVCEIDNDESNFVPEIYNETEEVSNEITDAPTAIITTSEYAIDTTEDLKKAVIYSEILQRKYT